MTLQLTDRVSKVPLIGPSMTKKLERGLAIITVRDLLYHLPSRYENFSLISKIATVQEGERITVRGKLLEIKNIFTRQRLTLQQAKIADDTGVLSVVWFNQPYLTKILRVNEEFFLSGKVQLQKGRLLMASPTYEKPQDLFYSQIHTGRLVPIYPETAGITSKWLRRRIYYLLQEIRAGRLIIKDPLEEKIRKQHCLMPLSTALEKIHFPSTPEEATQAKKRLAFDELLWGHIEAISRREDWRKQTVSHPLDIASIRHHLTAFIKNLPFSLTTAQKRAIEEIYEDLHQTVPMNRLLQGDVGSGKTVVAALAILAVNLNGYQAVLMAPTDILANQHFETLQKLGLEVGLITARAKKFPQAKTLVGTHALLFANLNPEKLGLIVIDEQHRFGVEQRSALIAKGIRAHVLTMTATPIPRTVALTLYKDLDLSVLDETPKNRLPVKTWVVPEAKREAAYRWIEAQNSQTFIICPLIEESAFFQAAKAATVEFEKIKKIFPHKRIGLIHGQSKDKSKILEAFRRQELDILVATPVIEVGLDIPTATIMVIENADRFGLAQLHQLRGRVGRGDKQSYCLLFGNNHTRLKLLEKINDGMKLAEEDLKFRGPGQRFGTSQHGHWDLKIADFSDLELIEKTRLAAQNPLLRQQILKDRIDFVGK